MMRDLYSNLVAVPALHSALNAATVNGLAVNVADASGVVFVLAVGQTDGGGGAFSVKLQESDDGASGWADVPAKWVQSNAPSPLASNSSPRIGYTGKKAFVRLVATKASGSALYFGAVAVMRPFLRPAL